LVNNQNKCFIIAEAGVNHNGSIERALEMVKVAAEAGADAIKFQSFKTASVISKGTKKVEYQAKSTGDDGDQFSMVRNLELDEEQHKLLVKESEKYGIEFMSTPFDKWSMDLLSSLGMKRIKIASGEITNKPLIDYLASFNLPIIISTGMTSLDEIGEAVYWIEKKRAELGFNEPLIEKLSILHCTSNYPAEPQNVNLNAMGTIAEEFKLPVGYSDHTLGLEVSIAAMAVGGTIIEKHFTLDKTLSGPDHQASLAPEELSALVSAIRNIEKAMGTPIKQPTASELPVRELVRRSIFINKALIAGSEITLDDLAYLRPGDGIGPKLTNEVIGRRLNRNVEEMTKLSWEFLD
jgi:N-acetylneuraminate synthase